MDIEEKNRKTTMMLRAEDRKIAIAAKKKEKEQHANFRHSSHSVKTILKVKPYWASGWPAKAIAGATGISVHSVHKICAALNKVELRSPSMKNLAIKASKDILKSDDNANRVKIIDKIFYDEKAAGSAVSVNLNINQKELEMDNPDFDFVELDNY